MTTPRLKPSRPNWYIGFKIDSDALVAVAATAPDGLKPVKTPDLHLTVAFMGDCDETVARQVWKNVLDSPPRARMATLNRLETVGLASCAKAYVVSMLKAESTEKTAEFMLRVRRQNHAQFGIEDYMDPFPHVTVARRGNSPIDIREAASAWCRDTDLQQASIRLDCLGLFTWSDDYRQPDSAADYVMVESLMLEGLEPE